MLQGCISPLPTLLSSTEFSAEKVSDRLNCKLWEFSLRSRTLHCTASMDSVHSEGNLEDLHSPSSVSNI